MKRTEKETFVADMRGRLERAQATYLVNYQGLDVEAMNALRNELRKRDVEFQVVKNRLLKLACKDTDTAVLEDHFVGPCAIAITYEDAVGPAKTLMEKSKDFKNLEIKVGQISGKLMDSKGIKRLAELPGREILLAQLLSTMQAVPSSFVRALNGVILNLCYVLKAVEAQKGEQGN
ncbi:MAG: 50S ribosomal protein L10 [Deltaproteobacteria bacterium]|nr:50S ribosomal protein L10 [Deltaproteobacteria bacterium]